jgi:hypothetical protein
MYVCIVYMYDCAQTSLLITVAFLYVEFAFHVHSAFTHCVASVPLQSTSSKVLQDSTLRLGVSSCKHFREEAKQKHNKFQLFFTQFHLHNL